MATTSKYSQKPINMPIQIQGDDLFTHMLVAGATRSGKTACLMKPMVFSLLLAKKRGVPLGISVLEPKGDLARMVKEMSDEMGIECTLIDPDAEETGHFNPMQGDTNNVTS